MIQSQLPSNLQRALVLYTSCHRIFALTVLQKILLLPGVCVQVVGAQIIATDKVSTHKIT